MMTESQHEEIRYLENKLKQNPDSLLFARLADAYLEMGRVEEALKMCEEGIRKHPYYVTGHFVMGKCYLSKKQFDFAEKELKRVLLFDSQYIAAHRAYGDLMEQIGWHNSSESSYKKIVELDPFNHNARQKLLALESADDVVSGSRDDIEIDLEEFEEPDVLPEPDRAEETGGSQSDTVIDFKETFTEPTIPASSEGSKDEEDENFSYILDDIFREEESHEQMSETPVMETDESVDDSLNNTDEVVAKDFAPGGETETTPTSSVDDELNEFKVPDIPETSDATTDIISHDELFGSSDDSADSFEINPMGIISPEKDENDADPLAFLENMEGESDDITPASDIPTDEAAELDAISPVPPVHPTPEPFTEDDENQLEEKLDQIDDIFELDTSNMIEGETSEVAPAADEMDETLDFLNVASEEEPEMQLDETPHGKDTAVRTAIPREEPEPAATQPEEEIRPKEKIVTPTLGEIYAAQHQYAKAIGVYEILRKNDPDNSFYEEKIAYLKKKLEESQNLE